MYFCTELMIYSLIYDLSCQLSGKFNKSNVNSRAKYLFLIVYRENETLFFLLILSINTNNE